MKEKLEYFCNSFKNGIILWLISILILYMVGVHIGDISDYNAEIMKLLDIKNFILHLVIVGFIYFIFELALICYYNSFDRIITLKANTNKKIFKEIIIMIMIFVVVLPILEYIKELDIVNKSIIKTMITVMLVKTIIDCIIQMIRTEIYNRKLREKNKK